MRSIYIKILCSLQISFASVLKFKLDNGGLPKHIHKKGRLLHIYVFSERMQDAINQMRPNPMRVRRHNGYHLMYMTNIEKNLQNMNINQNPGFSCSIKKFLCPSFVTKKSALILFLAKLVNSFRAEGLFIPIFWIYLYVLKVQSLTHHFKVSFKLSKLKNIEMHYFSLGLPKKKSSLRLSKP